MAPGPEGCHHIGDNNIKCLIIAGIHEEVCSAVGGARELSDHTLFINATITTISRTDKETRELQGKKVQGLFVSHCFDSQINTCQLFYFF